MKPLVLAALVAGPTLFAQVMEEPVVLTIDVENHVLYRGTTFDVTKIAKDPGPTTSVNQAFIDGINVGNIVAVNSKPAKGIFTSSYSHAMPFRSAPQPGQPIADFDSSATLICTWQIYTTDGAFLGMIRDTGAQSHTVVGALGGFFGAIGTHQPLSAIAPVRQASTAEDPANRRNLGGGKLRTVFCLYPRSRPAVLVTVSGPAVFHADFSPVTSANPARPGETLILGATGLGPVKPNLEPPGATRFSESPLQEVNAPVTVVFDDKELPVINKVGWPGQTNLYRVDFQVPSDASSGSAIVQLIATWIPGPVTTICVRAQ